MNIMQRAVPITLDDGTDCACYVAIPDAGEGPGLLLLHDRHGAGDVARHQANLLAEEGWVVLLPDLYARLTPPTAAGYDARGVAAATARCAELDLARAAADAALALEALRALPECHDELGVVGYDIGADLACRLGDAGVACIVAYDPTQAVTLEKIAPTLTVATIIHLAADRPGADQAIVESAAQANPTLKVYVYDGVAPGFDNRNSAAFNRPAQLMAKSRTLGALREALGPRYDLATLWENHLFTEFVERDVDDSMDTMVDDPYVLVVPTVTGGTGKRDLHRWYSKHFHFQNPEDTRIVPISRTVGSDRLVDEFIFCCTHDRVMDWLLPAIPPTGKYIEIPMIAVVNFRGARLYHEHIWWDQASVLVQAGLLDPTGLPVTGADQAAAMRDEHLPRNRLIPGWSS